MHTIIKKILWGDNYTETPTQTRLQQAQTQATVKHQNGTLTFADIDDLTYNPVTHKHIKYGE